MTTTTIRFRPTGLTGPRAASRRIDWLRIAIGTLLATLLLIGLMALAGRMVPAHPDWAQPSPGGAIGLADDRP
jgi:hypothetical protein